MPTYEYRVVRTDQRAEDFDAELNEIGALGFNFEGALPDHTLLFKKTIIEPLNMQTFIGGGVQYTASASGILGYPNAAYLAYTGKTTNLAAYPIEGEY